MSALRFKVSFNIKSQLVLWDGSGVEYLLPWSLVYDDGFTNNMSYIRAYDDSLSKNFTYHDSFFGELLP